MAAKSKHRRVLTDSAIQKTNFGSPSFLTSLSGSPLFTYTSTVTSFKCSGSSGRFSCSSPNRAIPYEKSNGQVCDWLEAMRSSSPPQVGNPSILNSFSLYSDVENIHCNDWLMRNVLRDVAKYFPTAIISGRCRDKVFEFVQLPELYYAGSHGMDIMGPMEGCNSMEADGITLKEIKDKDVFFQPASEYLPLMDKICEVLKERANFFSGARVEHNKFCITVHFRCVKEEIWSALAEEVRTVLYEYPGLSMTQGRKVLELRPSINWHKGKALEFLLKAMGLENGNKVLPVYIGDDRTDEDAFNVLKDKGYGCGILVSAFAKETSARYSLRNPSEVMDFLQRLLKWKLQAAEVQGALKCAKSKKQ